MPSAKRSVGSCSRSLTSWRSDSTASYDGCRTTTTRASVTSLSRRFRDGPKPDDRSGESERRHAGDLRMTAAFTLLLADLPLGGVERPTIGLAKGMHELGAEVSLVVGNASGHSRELVPPYIHLVDLGAGRVRGSACLLPAISEPRDTTPSWLPRSTRTSPLSPPRCGPVCRSPLPCRSRLAASRGRASPLPAVTPSRSFAGRIGMQTPSWLSRNGVASEITRLWHLRRMT